MRIDLPAQARQADGITLETARQHSDGDQQQQPIDPFRFPQTAALQLEDTGLLIPEQLLTAEALGLAPDQIQRGLCVADQVPGFLHR